MTRRRQRVSRTAGYRLALPTQLTGDSEEPAWSEHVGDTVLDSNLTRRVAFALFMVEALNNDNLVHQAPAIVGSQTPSALANAASQ